jgi:hypothetical protein
MFISLSFSEANLETFTNDIKGFLNRFDIHRVKLGDVVTILDEKGGAEMKEKLAQLVKIIKVTFSE